MKVGQIIDYSKLASHLNKNLPSFRLCSLNPDLAVNHHTGFRRMVSLVVQCIEKLSIVVCPGPSRNDLLKASCSNIKQTVTKSLEEVNDEVEDTHDYKKCMTALLSLCVMH